MTEQKKQEEREAWRKHTKKNDYSHGFDGYDTEPIADYFIGRMEALETQVREKTIQECVDKQKKCDDLFEAYINPYVEKKNLELREQIAKEIEANHRPLKRKDKGSQKRGCPGCGDIGGMECDCNTHQYAINLAASIARGLLNKESDDYIGIGGQGVNIGE